MNKKLAGAAAAAMTLGLLAAPAGAATRPLTKADCKDAGWEHAGDYKNQGDCVSAANHGATVVVPPDGTGFVANHNETVLTLG